MAAPAPPAPAPQAGASAALTEGLLTVVSEKTGYPRETLELGMDMETDLGVDSIKRVDILGTMQTRFTLPRLDPEELAELRTLAQIVAHLQRAAGAAAAPPAVAAPAPAPAPIFAPPPAPVVAAPAPAPAPQAGASAALTEGLLTVVSEKTGYPRETLELGMDMETDLGIDSIKRVDILGTMQTRFTLPRLDPEELAELRTLAQIVAHLQRAAGAAPPPPAPSPQRGGGAGSAPPAPQWAVPTAPATLLRLPAPDTLESPVPDGWSCVITDDGTPAAAALAGAMAERGWQPVVLRLPQSLVDARLPLPRGVGRVALQDTSEDQLAQALRMIGESYGQVGAFIHLHPQPAALAQPGGLLSEAEQQIVRIVFLTAKQLGPGLTSAAHAGRPLFMTVTRMDGELGAGAARQVSPVGGGLPGLVKSLRQEWPGVFCRAVDISPEVGAEQAARLVVAESADPDQRLSEVGHGPRGRVTLTAESAQRGRVMVGPDDVFLVSGGARGITAACVVGMARRFRCGFVLLGRTPLAAPPEWAAPGLDDAALKQRIAADIAGRGERPLPAAIQRAWRDIRACEEITATLRAVAEAGGRARYVCADVADEAGLRAALADAGPISGVIHGAGALADRRIEQKTGADFDAVLGPKIGGLRSLLAVAPPGGLRHLVLFSSGAGFYGNLGQSDYAIANEILNKAAYQLQRDHPACRVVALNWGPWDGGMVTPALKAMFAQRQIAVIPVDGGVEVLLTALAAERPGVQLVVGSPMRPAPAPLGGELRGQRSWRQLSLGANPFLGDHMIGAHAVLPAMAAASWMIDACQQLHPGYCLRRCDGFQVLKGVVFDEGLAERYLLELKETAKQEEQGLVRLDALISSSAAGGRPRYHYRATVELARDVPAPPTLAGLDLGERLPVAGALLYTDGTLFHGPGLRSVERVLRLDSAGLTLRCALPDPGAAAQGQFPAGEFNPLMADALFQACLIWVRRSYDAASLPLGWAAAEQYLPLSFDTPTYLTLAVREASEQRLVADIAAHDAAGRVALQLRGAEVAVSRQLNRLFSHASEVR